MPHHLAVVFLACLSWAMPLAAAPGITCPPKESFRATEEAYYLKDWDALHAAFKRYAHCRNIEISTAYAEAVARLLRNDWRHFDRLIFLTESDKNFERRIFNHLDQLPPADGLLQIIEKALRHCPSKGKYLCKKMLDHAMMSISKNYP